MPRMRIDKSVVFGGAATRRAKRSRVKQATERMVALGDSLETKQTTTRPCHGCGRSIVCDLTPIKVPEEFLLITPKFNAPLICEECRKDHKKFYAARKAMHDYFGWVDDGQQGWES